MTTDAGPAIREFVAGRYPQADFADDDDIFTLGFVNSLFAMELVLFIEDSCGFTIPNDDLTLDNFRSVRAMAALVARLTASSGVPVGRSEP